MSSRGESDSFVVEAATQLGFEPSEIDGFYTCSEEAILRLADAVGKRAVRIALAHADAAKIFGPNPSPSMRAICGIVARRIADRIDPTQDGGKSDGDQ